MQMFLLVLIAIGVVSADMSGVIPVLKELKVRLGNDVKLAEAQALVNLDNIIEDTKKGLAAIAEDPTQGVQELVLSWRKDLEQGLDNVREGYDHIKEDLRGAIENIREQLKDEDTLATLVKN